MAHPKSYNLESPVAVFRTAHEHWEFYAQGYIKVYRLTKDIDCNIVPGKLKITLTRNELGKRPDILTTLIRVLESWRP